MSTEVEARQSAEVANAAEADIAAAALAGLGQEDLVLPVLQVTQQLSGAVTDGEAEAGEFVNSLTGENHGGEVELIVAGYFKGRFYAPRDEDQVYVAQGDVAPSNWPEEYAGRRFDEIEDAEEQTRARANAPGGRWEPPAIQTTHNYIGLIPGSLDLPVRLSLKSTSVPAHRKIATLLRFAPGGRAWANVIQLRTTLKRNKRDQPYYVVEAARGRETTEEERQEAVRLAQDFQSTQNARLVGETDERAEERASVAKTSGDGLDVA